MVRYEADVITIGQNVEVIRHAHESATTRGSMSRPGPDDIPALKDVKAARRALESNEDKLKKCEAAYMVLETLEGFKDADLFSKEEWPIYDVLKEDLELTTKQTDGLFKTEDENFAVHHVRSMLKMKGTVEDVTKGMLAYWRDEKIPELREAVAKAKKVCKSVRHRYKAALDRLRLSRGLPDEAAVDKIQRYEAHLERGFHKALERLQALQEARGFHRATGRRWPWRSSRPPPRPAEWLRSAVLPMGRSKGDNGFVFRDGTREDRSDPMPFSHEIARDA